MISLVVFPNRGSRAHSTCRHRDSRFVALFRRVPFFLEEKSSSLGFIDRNGFSPNWDRRRI
jgi:hypothetical protein